MMGWFAMLKTILGITTKIFGMFKRQKYVEKVNELKHLDYKILKRKAEEKALNEAEKEISNFRSYLNKP